MQFYTNSYAFVSVLLIILELAILAVMWRVERKSTATRFLFAFFVCLLFNSLAMFWSNAGPVYPYIFIPTQDAFLIAGGVGLIGYAYYYPRNDQPREAWLFIVGFSLIALVAFAYNIYFTYDVISKTQFRSTSFYFGLLMPSALILNILIIARRAVHFAEISAKNSSAALLQALRALWRPPNATVLALRNFALALAVGIIQAIASAEFVSGRLGVHFIAIGAILGISAVALVYFSHAPEPVSFMVKLVGISLFTLLMVLGINGVNLIEDRRAEQVDLMQSIAANMTLQTIEAPEQPGLIPSEVRYIISWPADNSTDQAAYRLHFGRDDEPMASPAAIMAENINRLANGKMIQPASADQTNLIYRDPIPFPGDYTRVLGVQTLRERRVYEVGFLEADNLLLPVHREAIRQSLVVLVGSLFILIVFPLFFRRTLVTPLDNLLRGIKQADTGQLDMALPILYDDELGFLTRSFNQMVGSLRESQTSLQEIAQQLEAKVGLRTTELTVANEELERRNKQLQQTNQKLAHEIIERQEAEARERRQYQIAESLQQVALILNRTLDQQQVVTTILDQLQGIVPYDGAALWLIDNDELVIVESVGSSFRRVGWRLPLALGSPQALVVQNRLPQIIADITRQPDWPRWDEKGIIRSWMGVPLVAGQEAIGLLSLVRSDPDAYNREDLDVLQSFASQAVTAIGNARLYQQVNTAHERLAILYQASQVISAASLVPQQIYAAIYAAVTQLMPADVFVVTLIDETEQEAEDVYLVDQGQVWPGERYPLPDTFAHYLLCRGASLRVDDYSAIPQEEFNFQGLGRSEDIRSGLTVLLWGRERVLGLFSVHSYDLATYTGGELEMLELLAAHAAIALENTRLSQQAQTAAALEERNRLARDLHDSVTQSLYSLTLLAEGWRRLAQRGRLTDLDSALTELGEIAQQSLKEMRLLIYELRPPVLEQSGLLGALHQRLGAVERRAGIEARLIAEELINLPPPLEKGLYRITQEALNNALKHARATTVTVFVRARGEWIEIEIDDNGCGFEPERLNGQSGLGLTSMRERAEQLGGELVIESKPGMGTTIKTRVKGNS